VDSLQRKLHEVQDELLQEKEKSSEVGESDLKDRLYKLKTDYNDLQEVLNQPNCTRRSEANTHNKAIKEANAKVKSLRESLDERDKKQK
jgi:molybdopterin-biosynthesis enzyme MoeA-like protein